jgi:hypothetical protein
MKWLQNLSKYIWYQYEANNILNMLVIYRYQADYGWIRYLKLNKREKLDLNDVTFRALEIQLHDTVNVRIVGTIRLGKMTTIACTFLYHIVISSNVITRKCTIVCICCFLNHLRLVGSPLVVMSNFLLDAFVHKTCVCTVFVRHLRIQICVFREFSWSDYKTFPYIFNIIRQLYISYCICW